MNITQRAVKAAKPPASGNHIHYDDELRGFGLRVTAANIRSFVLNYSFGGRERRITIGRWPEWTADAARAEARKLRVDVDEGVDPMAQRDRARGEPLVSDLAADYLQRYAVPKKRPKSVHEDRLMLNRFVLPETAENKKYALGSLRVSAVQRRDVETLHTSLRKTPVQANRLLSLLSKMFSWAMDSGMRGDNPARGVKRFPEDKREVWLDGEKLQALATALDNYPDQNVANALRLLIVTGARPGEVLGAEWTMLDLVRGVWTKPSHHTKQKKTEHVPLSEAALMILRSMAASRTEGQVYLFPGRQRHLGKAEAAGEAEDTHSGRARTTLKNAWRQVCKAAGLATMYHVKGKRGKMLERWKPNVRVYDLRHSFASHLVSRGASLYLVGRLLGHTQATTTQRYAHVADGALRSIANGFSEVLAPKKPAESFTLKPPKKKGKKLKGERVTALLAGD